MGRDDPRERLTFVRPAALPGTEILAARDSLQGWHVFHERYEVCACRTAAAGWRYRDRTHFLNDGSLMLMEPGEMHRNTVVHKRSDFKVVFFAPETLEEAARALGAPAVPHFRFAQVEDPRLFAAVYRLCEAAEGDGTTLEQQSLLSSCILLMLERTEGKTPSPEVRNARPAIERAKAFLLDRYCEPVTLDELAAISGLSRFHLVRTFTRHVGVPPHAYQIHVRIERGRALIERGMAPVIAAAHTGFADQSHFNRHFKRIMRVTPGEYARSTARR